MQPVYKVAIGIVAVSTALLIGLVAFLVWRERVPPYVLPDTADIRLHVAGVWDWSTRERTCGDSTHSIAFAADGKIMTITSAPSATDSSKREDRITTYDISLVTPSRIRGAIRGEKRLTDAGVPVVWDLVLTGPDEYRWQRTDWPGDFAYTAPVIRCPTSQR